MMHHVVALRTRSKLIPSKVSRRQKTSPMIWTTFNKQIVEPFDLPSVDVAGEELNVTVIPRRENEFTCSVCFLVQNNSRIDHTEPDGSIVCKDCA